MFLKEIKLIKDNNNHNKYPFSIPSINKFEQLNIKSDVTFL